MISEKKSRNRQKEYSRQIVKGKNPEDVCQTIQPRKDRTINPSIFISKTFQILQKQQFTEIIRWNPDGNTFIITDIQRFEKEILPIYFRHRKFSSFVRQLNMYDFHKIRNEANSNIFQHKEFKRHSQHNLKNIKRKVCQSRKNISNQDSWDQNRQAESVSLKKVQKKGKNLRESSYTNIKTSSFYNIPQTRTKNVISENQCSRKELIDQFINSLPQIINSEKQMQEMVKEMKKNPKYSCISSKQDLKKIVRKIKTNKLKKSANLDDLQELSIQEEIIVQNIDGSSINDPSLAIFSTQKCIPIQSIYIIDSINCWSGVDKFIYQDSLL